MTFPTTILCLCVACVSGLVCFLIGRYRRTKVFADLRETLRDRTADRNHWMHEAEQWQGMYWAEQVEQVKDRAWSN